MICLLVDLLGLVPWVVVVVVVVGGVHLESLYHLSFFLTGGLGLSGFAGVVVFLAGVRQFELVSHSGVVGGMGVTGLVLL